MELPQIINVMSRYHKNCVPPAVPPEPCSPECRKFLRSEQKQSRSSFGTVQSSPKLNASAQKFHSSALRFNDSCAGPTPRNSKPILVKRGSPMQPLPCCPSPKVTVIDPETEELVKKIYANDRVCNCRVIARGLLNDVSKNLGLHNRRTSFEAICESDPRQIGLTKCTSTIKEEAENSHKLLLRCKNEECKSCTYK